MLEVLWRKVTLLHCWWEYKLLQSPRRTAWRCLKRLGIKLPYDHPTIPLLGIHLEKTIIEKTHTPGFILALFTIARTWKQPICLSTDEWIKKLWYKYTMECYSAIKNNTFESVLIRCMKLEPIIQGEVSKKVNNKHCILTHIYMASWNMVLINLSAGYQWRHWHREQTCGHNRGKERVGVHWNIYITICKIRQPNGNLLRDAGSSDPVLCDNLEG